MAEVVQETQQEFWRPPSALVEAEMEGPAASGMAEVCSACGSEFLLGSRFCHTCGARRPATLTESEKSDANAIAGMWERVVAGVRTGFARSAQVLAGIKAPSWLHYLHFHEIQRWSGLSAGSLIAFILGLACVAGALLVGLLTAKTYVDWQAIQFYRAEWLLGATASFVAGILLKKPSRND